MTRVFNPTKKKKLDQSKRLKIVHPICKCKYTKKEGLCKYTNWSWHSQVTCGQNKDCIDLTPRSLRGSNLNQRCFVKYKVETSVGAYIQGRVVKSFFETTIGDKWVWHFGVEMLIVWGDRCDCVEVPTTTKVTWSTVLIISIILMLIVEWPSLYMLDYLLTVLMIYPKQMS